jgi:hypothetical protein
MVTAVLAPGGAAHGEAQCHRPPSRGGRNARSANVIASDKTGTLTKTK